MWNGTDIDWSYDCHEWDLMIIVRYISDKPFDSLVETLSICRTIPQFLLLHDFCIQPVWFKLGSTQCRSVTKTAKWCHFYHVKAFGVIKIFHTVSIFIIKKKLFTDSR